MASATCLCTLSLAALPSFRYLKGIWELDPEPSLVQVKCYLL